ncbi:DUF2157 domain-containing protein [Octadecabacter sp. G9-8]|uniref:DUF2157 domain-containing protein n=1 Tax=Octadecabacter dasysiphoniae TaxID=2909341 RepID=A0ABS9CZF5_9RHOB|nr:DUF2157 domain-containing protein [Octadecabacter dasysiphoniae]MCF2871770.1 DUF2157 domain-containing protein [Octadecabacter dasysiphoniae]
MTHVIQTQALIAEGVITPDQGATIASRSRKVMVSLVINAVLCLGIIAAAIGFVFLLADALAVSIVGGLFLAAGAFVLLRAGDIYRMFGNAAALIGAGMLTFGAMFDLVDKLGEQSGGLVLIIIGAIAAAFCTVIFQRSPPHARFLTGSLTLMGAAMHIAGLYIWGDAIDLSGVPVPMIHLYVTLLLIGLGVLVDVRLVTALAIVPFAQMLETGTFYWHAMYAFYSPESTLSILQLGVAMAICVALAGVLTDRHRRHSHMFGIMAFIVANMCFLVGSLWGDVVGSHIWGPGHSSWRYDGTFEEFRAAKDAFEASTLVISEHVYSIVWAILLIAAAFWAATTSRRGIFNAAMTFGGIHA